MISVIKGDITRLDFDVIVHPSNTSLTPGIGLSKAIFQAGGYRLVDACQRLGGCHVGQAKMTLSYNLPCRAVIHTVGPIYSGNKKDKEYLEGCYWNSMSIAYEFYKLNKLERMSLAFPSIATGMGFGYPKEEACTIAIKTIQMVYMAYPQSQAIDVIFVCNDEEEYLLYKERLRKR